MNVLCEKCSELRGEISQLNENLSEADAAFAPDYVICKYEHDRSKYIGEIREVRKEYIKTVLDDFESNKINKDEASEHLNKCSTCDMMKFLI